MPAIIKKWPYDVKRKDRKKNQSDKPSFSKQVSFWRQSRLTVQTDQKTVGKH